MPKAKTPPATPISPRRWILSLSLAAAVILVFCPILQGQFIDWDDLDSIARNPDFASPTWASWLGFWSHSHFDLFIPLTDTLWLILASLGRNNSPDSAGIYLTPGLFHFANLLLHAANALLVFSILRLLVRRDWPAFAGALLFALHPMQVESVAWISGGKDVLCGTFSLLCIQQYLRYAAATIAKRRHLIIALIAMAAAILAKPSAVSLPLLLAVLDFGILRRPWRKALPALAIFALLAIPGIVIGRLSQSAPPLPFIPPIPIRPVITADAFYFYIIQLIAPIHLALDYGRTPQWLLAQPLAYFSWIFPTAPLAFAWLYRRQIPWALPAMLLSIAALLPVLGLIPFDFQAYSTVADHYFYIAMLGPALAAAFLLAGISTPPRRRMAAAITTICLLAFAARSFLRALDWRDTVTLFTANLEVNPDSLPARLKIAADLTRRGQTAAALQQFHLALQAHPDDPDALCDWASRLFTAGRPDNAALLYRASLRQRPDSFIINNDLTLALEAVGKLDEAIPFALRTVALAPNFAEGHSNLARLFALTGRYDQAVTEYQTALRLNPNLAAARVGLADALGRQRSIRSSSLP